MSAAIGQVQGAVPAIRWNVLSVAVVAAMVEGYDAQVLAYVAPLITREWSLPPGTFRGTFTIGLVGLALGCLFIAPLADRLGRKWIIIGSTLSYGVLVLVTAAADSLTQLFWLRFFTGLGLGGALPNLAATAAESAVKEKRTFAVAVLFCGFGFGSFVGSVVAHQLMTPFGWQSVFVFGGAGTLLLVPFLLKTLPRGVPGEELRDAHGGSAKEAIPLADLFRDGRKRATIALWVIYFMGLMDLYVLQSWLPTIFSDQGISVETSALITGGMQLGGITGALMLSPLVDRMGPNPLLPAAYAIAAVCIFLIGLIGPSVPLLTLAVLGAGFGIIGCQNCNSGVAARIYPAEMRATGVGWALGIGRIGSIIGPYVVGYLLSLAVDVRTIFVLSAIPALVAAVAYLLIGRRAEFERG
jgi:AAHS family 4-hydroxybenzoate transporter-like MFS transporter